MRSNVAPVRWRRDEPRRGPVYPPLADDHPAATVPDVLCGTPLGDGKPVQLLVVGPGDEEGRERHDAGRWYTADAVVVHEWCLTRLSDDDVETVISELVPRELDEDD